jgi:NAD(P)-dependent dehydrogenase (short-subunit alcohol dehydrogenase family)
VSLASTSKEKRDEYHTKSRSCHRDLVRLRAGHGRASGGTRRRPAPSGPASYDLLPLDVRSDESVQSWIETVLQRAGRIDLLVNNAGNAQGGAP